MPQVRMPVEWLDKTPNQNAMLEWMAAQGLPDPTTISVYDFFYDTVDKTILANILPYDQVTGQPKSQLNAVVTTPPPFFGNIDRAFA